jgi:hypothetical protein
MVLHLDLVLAMEYTPTRAAALDACCFTRTLAVQADLNDLQFPNVEESCIVGWYRQEHTAMVRWIVPSESVCIMLRSQLAPIDASV